jgi:hypothetical protein
MRALDWKMFIYFMVIWNILWRFGIFYDHLVHFVFIWRFGIFYDHLVHFVFIWYIFPGLVSRTKKNLATLLVARRSRSVPESWPETRPKPISC